jgi:hypothetical protein
MSNLSRTRHILVTGVTLNSAATDVATLTVDSAKWRLIRVMVTEASTTLVASPATLGVFTGAGGTGTTLVALATLTTLITAPVFVDMTLAVTTSYQTSGSVFIRCGTAHGSAATVSVVLEYMKVD